MAYKEELTGRLRVIKTREYDADHVSIIREVQQEWRVWPDIDESPDHVWEEWRGLPEYWAP